MQPALASCRLALDVAAAANFVLAAGYACDCLAISKVLFGKNALGESGRIVCFEHGNCVLQNNRAVVKVLIDKVHGAAGDLDSVIEGLLLCIEAGEGRQQRGMDVENAIGKGGDELRREQAHVAGEADEIDLAGAKGSDHVVVVLGAGAALGDEHFARQAQLSCGSDAGGIGDVGDYDGDFDVGQAAFGDRVGDGEEVGAAAGEEDAEF